MDQNAFDIATALGTVGAAFFAGWAAFSSSRAAGASRDLVLLERDRDQERTEAATWRQARRLTVDAGYETLLDGDGAWIGVDAYARVTNGSDAPISKARIKLVCDSATWGPQLVGPIAPGNSIAVMARLLAPMKEGDLNALARFLDVNGRPWVADARGALTPDSDDNLTRWIEDGREFAQRDLQPQQRGSVEGAVPVLPDFDAWRLQFEDEEIDP